MLLFVVHNIIHIHNNVLRDRQYFMEYSCIDINNEIFHKIMLAPHNIMRDFCM